ncbi:CCA tRNA nucleotidyltransferase [Clostridium aminobutyricum]|uniref:CCA tRNA nucleotidyltransferase n=1 Tax=Clostridium aminobutyricum TaxID=33953 RepID=A0A939IGT0_CLOAM|nr:hypothetical protein [Clostridium aminobutyricum]MBN7773860.1 hypothetical protein [Clostridium aminobutyricum]
MIKLPKEVNGTLKLLEEKGFEAYVVGGCVRDSLIGLKPLDWDIATSARIDELKRIFPEAQVLSEEYGVIRMVFPQAQELPAHSGEGPAADCALLEEALIVDIATFRIEGPYSDYKKPDHVTFTGSLEEDLTRRDFTINAIAYNPQRTLADPNQGRQDMKEKQIKAIGDPILRFEENPIRMLRAVRFAAELDFDLHQSVYDAIVAKAFLLDEIPVESIRSQFEKIIVSQHTRKGLKLLIETGLMDYIAGQEVSSTVSKRELEDLDTYICNIDKTKQVRLRRLALFYKCFDLKRSVAAIEYLKYSGKDEHALLDGVHLVDKLYFITNKYEMKKFLVDYGMERYEFLDNLSKAQRIVYDLPVNRIHSRKFILDNIREFQEPIFVEDLAINGDDLLKEGIASGAAIGKLLNMLLDVVHMKPNLNTKEDLMTYARTFSKNKLAASMRKIRFIR